MVNPITAPMNTFEQQFNNLKDSVVRSIVLVSKPPSIDSPVGNVHSSQELGTVPTENSQQSAINTTSACFVSDEVAINTKKNLWTPQPTSSQKAAIDTKLACVVANNAAKKTTKRAWEYQRSSVESGLGFAGKKVDVESVAKTRKLLDGAIALAWKNVKSNHKPPALTCTRWVWRLAGSYHLTHFTPQLMEKAALRFTASGCKSLAQWATEKASEERGHDRLALLDIQSMGYQAEAVVEALVPPAAAALVNYFIRSVWNRDPINCVGYSYTMERLALSVGEKYIQQVEVLLPPGVQATRCLRVHSSVGADAEHVEETVRMVAELNPQQRNQVAAACYDTALLCFNPPKGNYISDEELLNVLRPLQRRKNHS